MRNAGWRASGDGCGEDAAGARNPNVIHEAQMSAGDRMADRLARGAGSWTFIIIFGLALGTWIVINMLLLGDRVIDPFPYILLNLMLSCLAAIQAPVILMSQNRQEMRDRIQVEQDYQVNVKAEVLIEELVRRTEGLEDALREIRSRCDEIGDRLP